MKTIVNKINSLNGLSIDDLIALYRNGYRLDEHTSLLSGFHNDFSNIQNKLSNIHPNIYSLQGPLLDPVVNFGKVTVSTGYDAVATSIILNTNEGSKLPDPSIGAFNLVWWNSTDYPDPSDDPNKEIVRCTAKTTDTLTVTRPQEGTSASIKNLVGKTYKMILSPTAKTMSDISSAIIARVAKTGDTMSGDLGFSSGNIKKTTGDLLLKTPNATESTDVTRVTITGSIDTATLKVESCNLLANGANNGFGTAATISDRRILHVRGNLSSASEGYGVESTPIQTVTTGSLFGFASRPTTSAAVLTVADLYGVYILPSKGAGSTITNAYGIYIENINQGSTLNYAIFSAGGNVKLAGNLILGDNSKIIGGTSTTANLTLQTTSGVGTSGADMHFLVGNNGATEAMTILNNGSVGIGTTTPTSLLDVHGTTQLRGYVGGTGLTVDAGGNVGIGTTGPSMQLEIAKSADYTIAGLSTWSAATYYHAPNLQLQRSKSSTIGTHTAVVANDYLGNIAFQGSDGVGFITAAGIRADAEGTITTNIVPGRLVFRTMNSAGTLTEVMRIDSSGNVGIGTTNPAAKLNVVDTSTTPVIAAQISYTGSSEAEVQLKRSQGTPSSPTSVGTTSNIGSIGFYPYVSSFVRRAIIGSSMDGATDAAKLSFIVTPTGGSLTEALTIKSSGNVGIGTTNPTVKLEVSGGDISIDSGRQIQMSSPGDINWGIKITPNAIGSNPSMDFRAGAGNGYFRFIDTPGIPNVRMIIEGNTGNVGIGTTTPTSLLDVNGTVQLRGIVGGTGLTVDAGGKVGIGTTNPVAKLDVRGDVFLGDPGVSHAVISSYDGIYINTDRGNTGISTGVIFGRDRTGTSGGTTDMVIGSDGSVGIGTVSPQSVLDVRTSSNTADLFNGYMAALSNYPVIRLAKARGNLITPETVVSGDPLGAMRIQGYDGTDYIDTAGIYFDTVGTIGTQRVPSNIKFYVHPDSTSAQFEAMRIAYSGNVGIGTTTPSEALDVAGNIKVSGTVDSVDISTIPLPTSISYNNQSFINIVKNGNFESWSNGTTNAPDGFINSGSYPLGGIAREAIIVKYSSYSAKLIAGSSNYPGLEYDLNFSKYKNVPLTIGMWVYVPTTNTLNNALITIFYDNGAMVDTLFSCPKNDTWTYYQQNINTSNYPNWNGAYSTVRLHISPRYTDTTEADVMYIDGLIIVEGSVCPIFSEKPLVDDGKTLYISSTNNRVGIGTTVPTSLLDVHGTTQLRGIVGGTGLTVDAGGNVGIGTTSPSSSLEVSGGQAHFKGSTDGSPSIHIGNTGVANAIVNSGDGFYLNIDSNNDQTATNFVIGKDRTGMTGGTVLFQVQENGNVGIGTTSPSEELDVSGTAKVGKYRDTTAPGSANYKGLFIRRRDDSGMHGVFFASDVNDTQNQYWENMLIYNDGGGGSIGFWTGETAAERMRITNIGNIGIGTTSPQTKLDVNGESTFRNDLNMNGNFIIPFLNVIRHYLDTSYQADIFAESAGASTGRWIVRTKDERSGGTYAQPINIKWGYLINWDTRIGILNADPTYTLDITGTTRTTSDLYVGGNVGIGTISPGAKLEVNGTLKWGGSSAPYISSGEDVGGVYLEQVGTNTTNGTIRLQSSPSGNQTTYATFTVDPVNGFSFTSNAGGNSGNVGIGTTNPTKNLDVNGSARITNPSVITGQLADIIFKNYDISSSSIGSIRDDAMYGNFFIKVNNGSALGEVALIERFRITRDGNIGIGTTVPNATLDVEESGGATVRVGRTSSGFLQMDSDGTDSTIMMTGSGGIKLKTNGDNVRMYIKNDGNVGIGTTTPVEKLEVSAILSKTLGSSGWGIKVTDKTTGGGAGVGGAITFGGIRGTDLGEWSVAGIAGAKDSSVDGEEKGDLVLYSSTAGTLVERMRILHNGNVGIGITTPTSKLQTSGSFSAQIITISGSVTLDETYYTVLCNAGTAFTVTLPDASTCPGRIYNIKKKDSSTNIVTITTTGGQTIDGATSRSINIQYETVSTQSDGIQWWVV